MPVILRRLWIQVTSDRKRFGMLCAVVGVAMLLWARLIVVSRMPRMAVANDVAVETAGGAMPSSTPESQTNVTGPGMMTSTTTKVALDSHAGRDPFVINPRYFPRPTSIANLGPPAEKSAGNAVEESMQAEQRITAQLRAMAQTLRLEAVVSGSIAVINGRTYRVGDVIEAFRDVSASEPVSFRIVEVNQRSAMLEFEDRRFEIRMNQP